LFTAQMSTFAETAKVDYHWSFADQGKQTSVFHFPFVANKWKWPFSVISVFCLYIFTSKWQHIYSYISISIYIFCIYICSCFQTENRQLRTRRFSLFRYHLLIVQTEVYCLSYKKQWKSSICNRTKRIKKRTCPSMVCNKYKKRGKGRVS
jgi:hypothetical protein